MILSSTKEQSLRTEEEIDVVLSYGVSVLAMVFLGVFSKLGK